MGVYIQCMKIPKSCDNCLFRAKSIVTNDYCYLTAKCLPCECPLIEVPDGHGRLIDADELRKEFKEPMNWLDAKQCTYHVTGIWSAIDAAETVIPEERRK